MNKKMFLFYLLLTILISLFAFNNCVVNNGTGLIVIQNTCDKGISNIKIGRIYIGYLHQGANYNLWYCCNITGKLSADGIDVFQASSSVNTPYIEDANCTFKTNYFYEIIIIKDNTDDSYKMSASYGVKPGADSDAMHYPAD